MIPKLNLRGVKELTQELNNKVIDNFISNVSVANSSDITLTFSFYNKEKLLVSLNHNSPFLSFIDSSYSSSTTLGNLNENLRKYIKGSYITKIEQVNGDRVIKFSLTKTNEFYQKDIYYLIIELIPTINNLIILNDKEEILFAKHFSDLTAARPIIKGMKYIPLETNQGLVETPFDMNKFKESVHHYLLDIDEKSKKENALPLFNFLKQRHKSLLRKIVVLTKEIDESKKKLEYKEIGETLLTLKDDEENLKDYLPYIKETYDNNISTLDNANKYFEKYKKSKRTIENDTREIDIAKKSVEEIEHILSIFAYYSDSEIEELYKKYLPKKVKQKRSKEVDARLPYYLIYKGVRIGFGKNKEQNNFLTFKKAEKTDVYLHASNYHGAHVVIFDNDPSEEVILLAAEIALILSNLESGDVYIADIKDVKKGNSLGETFINKYETITLHGVRESTKLLLKEQKRFQN